MPLRPTVALSAVGPGAGAACPLGAPYAKPAPASSAADVPTTKISLASRPFPTMSPPWSDPPRIGIAISCASGRELHHEPILEPVPLTVTVDLHRPDLLA